MSEAAENVEISIVIPCLNEAAKIGACVEKAHAALKSLKIPGEIVVADNGSTDGSQQIASQHGARVVHADRRGYGAAVMAGVAAGQGVYVITGDADGSYDFGEIAPFIEKLREGYDLVMGSRMPLGGGRIMPGAMPFMHKWVGTPILTFIGRLFFGAPITDINTGMRGFRRDTLQRLGLDSPGMEFSSEMVIKAALDGLKIIEIPITLYPDADGRVPHIRTWQDGWRHLRVLLLYSPRWLFIVPGIVLFTLGLAAGIILVSGTVRFGAVEFDRNTLLVMAMFLLVGFQLLSLGVFAKKFAIRQGVLPEDPRIEWLSNSLKLEYGVVIGGVLMLAGLALLIWALWIWGELGFGKTLGHNLTYMVIPSVTLILLGIQVISASFFLSVLDLRNRED